MQQTKTRSKLSEPKKGELNIYFSVFIVDVWCSYLSAFLSTPNKLLLRQAQPLTN